MQVGNTRQRANVLAVPFRHCNKRVDASSQGVDAPSQGFDLVGDNLDCLCECLVPFRQPFEAFIDRHTPMLANGDSGVNSDAE